MGQDNSRSSLGCNGGGRQRDAQYLDAGERPLGCASMPHDGLEHVPAHAAEFGVPGGSPHVEQALGGLRAQAVPHVTAEHQGDVVWADVELLRR